MRARIKNSDELSVAVKDRKFSLFEAIGNTPLVELKNLNGNPMVKILGKLEGNNPGGSVKDRPAYYMISRAEESGKLTKDKASNYICQNASARKGNVLWSRWVPKSSSLQPWKAQTALSGGHDSSPAK